MRSPNWNEKEIMLALDLYLQKGSKWVSGISDRTFEVIALSSLLNALDFYTDKPQKFRSTGSIRMKLANFMSLDKDYKSKALGNISARDKEIWNTYREKTQCLHEECRTIIIEHLKSRNNDIEKYIKIMSLNNEEEYNSNFTEFTLQLKNALSYYKSIACEPETNLNHGKVQECCKRIEDALLIIDKNEPIIFEPIHEYKEHGGVNLAPLKQKKRNKSHQSKENQEQDATIEKIGKLVNRTFNDLVNQKKLTDEMITLLQQEHYSKVTFGLSHAFLKEIEKDGNLDVKSQITDTNGYVRYWVRPIEIDGNLYCICKEWYENQRNKYNKWLDEVDKKPFYMVDSAKLLKLLEFILKVDSENICIKRKDITTSFSGVEINEVIEVLIERGILSRFQDSNQELVVDDYDALYRIVSNPKLFSK